MKKKSKRHHGGSRLKQAKVNQEIKQCPCECHQGVSIMHMMECCKHIDESPVDLRTIDE